jgi:hypothetical protein
MEIKLIKTHELTGKIWFKLFAGNSCLECFHEDQEQQAKDAFESAVALQKLGLPKEETILSQTV